jgi:O-antigen ligase/tetratricopeptide (TPR) repeat protein
MPQSPPVARSAPLSLLRRSPLFRLDCVSPPVRAAISTALLTALLAYTILTPLAPFARQSYENDVRRHLILGVVLAAWPLLLLALRRLPERTALDPPILLTVLAVAAGTYGSLDRRVSLEWALVIAPLVPLYYLLVASRLFSVEAGRRAVLLAASVSAVFALASVWTQWQEWLDLVRAVEGSAPRELWLPPSVPRVKGTGSHPNVLAAVLAVSAPFFVLALAEAGRWMRAIAGIGAAAVLAALFFTLSRAAWVGALAGVAVTLAGLAVASRYRPRHPLRWLAALVVACVLAAGLAIAIGGARPDWLFRDSLDPRSDMRRAGLEIFKDNPLTGAGPGMYVALYPRYDGAYPFAAVHSHNVAVQIAADYGMTGLGAGLVMLGALAWLLVRAVLRGGPEERRNAALAAGSLTAFLVHGLADSPHLFPEVLLILALAVGPLVVRDAPRAADDTHARESGLARVRPVLVRTPALLALVLGLALLPLWWRDDRAAAEYRTSVRAASQNRVDDAVLAAARAADRDPHMAVYHFQHGATLLSRYYQLWGTADRDAAIAAYERGLALHPDNGAAWVDLAALRLDAGDQIGAQAALESLRPLAGRDTLLQLAYATLVQRAWDEPSAIETYAGLLTLNPTLALTPFFQSDESRAAWWPRIVDRAVERADEITGPGPAAEGLRTAIRVLTGRDAPSEERLRASLAASPGDVSLQVALGRLLLAGGRTVEAEAPLRAAVARTGDSLDAHAALGDWYAATGDQARARREWLKALHLGDVRAGDALGQSYPAGEVPDEVIERQRRLVEGASITRFYTVFQTARFTFLRQEPSPIISLGDWLNALPNDFERWRANVERWQQEQR